MQHELGMKILRVIHRHPPVPSGLRWGLKTIDAHLGEPYSDILSALSWLKQKNLITEENGEIALTDLGRNLVS